MAVLSVLSGTVFTTRAVPFSSTPDVHAVVSSSCLLLCRNISTDVLLEDDESATGDHVGPSCLVLVVVVMMVVFSARSRGITLITLQQHSTHKMQPLDRSYFKSLKSAYNAAADSWMVPIPAYNMAAVFRKAFLRSTTPDKAMADFRMCRLWPYDADIFKDEDYVASAVTDENALPLNHRQPCHRLLDHQQPCRQLLNH